MKEILILAPFGTGLKNACMETGNAFCYNAQSEVTDALMGTNSYTYAYDPIGSRITASVLSASSGISELSVYSANRLNQYSLISNHVNHVNPGKILPTYDLNGNMTWDGTIGD